MTDQNEYRYYQQDPGPQNGYGYQNPIPTSGGPVGPEQPPRKKGGWRKAIALVLVCALVGGGAGIGGAALYNSRTNSGDTTVVQELDRPQVQTVVNSKNGQAMTGAELYAANLGSCVGITVSTTSVNIFGQTTTSAASGSGFVLTQDGYIVTNYHVIEDAAKDSSVTVEVAFANGDKYPAKLVGGEQDNDVAVLKIEAAGLTPVTLGDSGKLVVGEPVYAIGNPLGELTYTLTDGIVSALDRLITTSSTNANGRTESVTLNVLQTNCAINPGNSGGPLLNNQGQVIGVNSAKIVAEGYEGLGFSIPIKEAKVIIDDLLKYGYVKGRVMLGIMGNEVATPGYEGFMINSINEGSVLQGTKAQAGDIITHVNKVRVTTYAAMRTELTKYNVGDTITLTLLRVDNRTGKTVSFDVQCVLGESTGE